MSWHGFITPSLDWSMMAGNARRTRVGGVRGHVWAPQTKVRRPDRLARHVARRARAPYLRRWALIIALATRVRQGLEGRRGVLGPAVGHDAERLDEPLPARSERDGHAEVEDLVIGEVLAKRGHEVGIH